MSSFDWDWDWDLDWDLDPVIPFYNKQNREQVEGTSLYKDLWEYLRNFEYNYMRQFNHWKKYTFFIVYNFPNVSINEMKKDLGDVLRNLHGVRTHENMGIDTHNSTNDILNFFLDKLKRESTKNIKKARR